MKKTIAITSALAAASSLATAEIKINEFLSFAGFVDMSYSHTNTNDDGGNESDNSFGVDQVEIDWLFNFGKVTARVDLEYEGDLTNNNGDKDLLQVEQAFASYDLGNGLVITGGRYESGLGLEDKEPTGLYQYSTAYTLDGETISVLPQYAQGVKAAYTSNGNTYYVSLQDETDENDAGRLGGDNSSSYAIEAGASIDLGNGLNWFIGGVIGETQDEGGDTQVINTHLTYQSGDWTFGAELTYGESSDEEFNNGQDGGGLENDADDGVEQMEALIMANYAYNECCSITGRISLVDATFDDNNANEHYDVTKYTLAHNNALTDNLAVITEVSYIDGDLDGEHYEELVGAVEVLFTF